MPEENSAKTQVTDTPQANPPVQENSSDAQDSQDSQASQDSGAPSTTPTAPAEATSSDVLVEVARKIGESQNVLIALSSDPSVDEMAAAIGLSLFLDKMGKRATAIYSGTTPNALEFLKPEETFESTTDTLQDFVIALNKEKADHLRYKLDGDFVKIYITPYKTKISEEDLDFSYGDFNVDLVLALDVANGTDLDSALREHGRIMHDASIVNITTGNPGKLGEIEWSDKSASSVSEMIAKLLYSLNGKVQMGKEEATAFLTGIVAATNRFSNTSTTPETMKMSSRLMESGANQQLISNNITPDMENEMINMMPAMSEDKAQSSGGDPTKLDIEHGSEEGVDESKEVDTDVTKKESTLLDGLKAAEEDLSQAGNEAVPDEANEPLKVDAGNDINEAESEIKTELAPETELTSEAELTPETGLVPETEPTPEAEPAPETELTPETESTPEVLKKSEISIEPEGNVKDEMNDNDQPSVGLGASTFEQSDSSKYGEMLENALKDAGGDALVEPTTPIMSTDENPAAASVPEVPSAPEVNGVPNIDYMPMPDDQVLPPPPAPPIDTSAMPMPDMGGESAALPVPAEITEPIEPAAPTALPTPEPLGAQPAMQDQVYAPQASDPGAFKIPGA